MPYVIAATVLLLIGSTAFVYWRWHKQNLPKPWIEGEQIQIDDSTLGQCVVSLPVVGQNQSRGFVKLTRELDGASVEFCNTFIDESGGTDGMDIAIRDLRTYFRLASDPERMKYFKNSIPSQLEMHNLLVPESPITESELESTVKLWSVVVMGPERAWFRFSSKKFMNGRPICVTVTKGGGVKFVGTG